MATTLTAEQFKKKYGQNAVAKFGQKKQEVPTWKLDSDPTFTERVKSDFNKRLGYVGDTMMKAAKGDITPVETGIRVVGDAAGLVTDIFGEAVSPALKPVLGYLFSTPDGRNVAAAMKLGADKYKQLKNSSPGANRIAEVIEGLVNIASILPAYKAAEATAKTASKGAKATAQAAKDATEPIGKGLEKTGELFYKSAIPLSDAEAAAVRVFKAKNPLAKRIAGEATEQPLTAGLTAFKKGFAGTEEMIGIQATREASTLWDDTVKPALQSIPETIQTDDVIKSVKNKIMTNVKEPIRQRDLLEGLDYIDDAYKGVPTMSHTFAQDIKSSLYKFIPEKMWKGKPIASSVREVQAMFASELRNRTRTALKNSPEVLAAFDDYGNLKALMEFGQKAMTGAKFKGGAGSWLNAAKEKLLVPTQTVGGQILKKAGRALQGK